MCRQLAKFAMAKKDHVTARNAPTRNAGQDVTLRALAATPSLVIVSGDAALEYSIDTSCG